MNTLPNENQDQTLENLPTENKSQLDPIQPETTNNITSTPQDTQPKPEMVVPDSTIPTPNTQLSKENETIIANKPEKRSNKKSTLILVGIIVAVILLMLGAIRLTKSLRPKKTGEAPTLVQKIAQVDLSKYEKDSDQDLYPDFIEEFVGLNPNESSYNKCYQNNPCVDSTAEDVNYKKNILIILDASGSMQLENSGTTRMEAAKSAIINYVKSSSQNTNFGVMVYGHKGSNNTIDKPVSCESAALLKSIGGVTAENITTIMNPVKPVGWTNMGYAIDKSLGAFVGKEGTNEIILVSDGIETCDSKPIEAATKAKDYGITVNIIGFAVDADAASQLEEIAQAGGGTYAYVNSAEEMINKFNISTQNSLNLNAESRCLYAFNDEARACYKEDHDKVLNWVFEEQRKLYNDNLTQQEYDKLKELEKSLMANYTSVTQQELDKIVERLAPKQKQIYGQ